MWGSWPVLERELERRRRERDEEDRRRQGLSALITYLKKVNKDQIRRVQDAEVKLPNDQSSMIIIVCKISRHLERGRRGCL